MTLFLSPNLPVFPLSWQRSRTVSPSAQTCSVQCKQPDSTLSTAPSQCPVASSSVSKPLLSACSVPGTVLGKGHTKINKICPSESTVLWRRQTPGDKYPGLINLHTKHHRGKERRFNVTKKRSENFKKKMTVGAESRRKKSRNALD